MDMLQTWRIRLKERRAMGKSHLWKWPLHIDSLVDSSWITSERCNNIVCLINKRPYWAETGLVMCNLCEQFFIEELTEWFDVRFYHVQVAWGLSAPKIESARWVEISVQSVAFTSVLMHLRMTRIYLCFPYGLLLSFPLYKARDPLKIEGNCVVSRFK